METPNQEQDFAAVKARLDEIVQAVSDDSLPLDDALALYEEAVTLGLRVSDLLEVGIAAENETDEAAQAEVVSPEGMATAEAQNAIEEDTSVSPE